MKRIVIALAALVLGLGIRPAGAQGFQVVVNASNGVSSLSKGELSALFLKKAAKFAGGHAATPVDQGKASAARAAFSKAVHGKSAAALDAYWQQQIFSGADVPPTEKGSDAEVLAFVRANPGGIGYVSAGASVGDGVKAIPISGL